MNQRYDARTLTLLRSERDQMAERFAAINTNDVGARAAAEIALRALDDKIERYSELLQREEPYSPPEYREQKPRRAKA